MGYCNGCGRPVEAEARFCPRCAAEAGNPPREKRPSVWRWSRGADLACLLLIMALGGIAAAASQAGIPLLMWGALAMLATLFLALIIHAVTGGRRFSK